MVSSHSLTQVLKWLVVIGVACSTNRRPPDSSTATSRPNEATKTMTRSSRFDTSGNPARDDISDAAPPPSVSGRPIPEASPTGPITSSCVLHGAYANSHKRRALSPDGSQISETASGTCAADAECVETKGQAAPGDGFVSVHCEERTCTCTLEPLAPGAETVTFTFDSAEPCNTTEQANKLMIAHCMKGIRVLGAH